ncbi:splicing regulator SDE2 isoform X3 [Stegastes partitus]|uniref:Replication stress response regulator SDE2 n=1 Tax=Stegastes partitus TaxID=144197 RepID=A0A9Y4NU56_9TELE|nr:PREDICTED: protein SDE2 homolog isoform X3 [Stegastes partitus]
MEVSVSAPSFRCSSFVFPDGSVVGDVLTRFVQQQDFYVVRNGRRSDLQDPLQHGAVYHLEPRLCGGKGGFGSMLRALGAQIEKTTNREACRDLSGRRLRDVNHEKEMAEWLKKQAEREADKEQRRLERLQRKLAEPKHQFTDPEYQRQCHDLSERLEDSVLKGLQVSSSSQVKAADVSAAKRPNLDQSEQPARKKKKKETAAAAAACFWAGVGDLEELLSSEDEDDEDESPSTSSSSCAAAAVAMTTHRQETEPERSGSSSPESASCSSSAAQMTRTSEDRSPPGPSTDRSPPGPSTDRSPPGPSTDRSPPGPSTDRSPPGPSTDRSPPGPSTDQSPPGPSRPSESSCVSQQLDLSSVSSVQQLESLGLDVLKEELMSRGLKCGGTLSERASRLFSVRGLSPDQIDPALLAKPSKSRRK